MLSGVCVALGLRDVFITEAKKEKEEVAHAHLSMDL
jgi:hypothetical protein